MSTVHPSLDERIRSVAKNILVLGETLRRRGPEPALAAAAGEQAATLLVAAGDAATRGASVSEIALLLRGGLESAGLTCWLLEEDGAVAFPHLHPRSLYWAADRLDQVRGKLRVSGAENEADEAERCLEAVERELHDTERDDGEWLDRADDVIDTLRHNRDHARDEHRQEKSATSRARIMGAQKDLEEMTSLEEVFIGQGRQAVFFTKFVESFTDPGGYGLLSEAAHPGAVLLVGHEWGGALSLVDDERAWTWAVVALERVQRQLDAYRVASNDE